MFRRYRTTRFPDIADFYAAIFEKLRQSDMGVKVGFRDILNAPPSALLLEMPRDDHSHIMKQMVA